MVTGIIKNFIPPILMHYYRKWRAEKRFKNIYKNFNAVGGGEDDWRQKEWLEYSKYKLDNTNSTYIKRANIPMGYMLYPVLATIFLSKNSTTHILDFGGGTGRVYFMALKYLRFPKKHHLACCGQ